MAVICPLLKDAHLSFSYTIPRAVVSWAWGAGCIQRQHSLQTQVFSPTGSCDSGWGRTHTTALGCVAANQVFFSCQPVPQAVLRATGAALSYVPPQCAGLEASFSSCSIRMMLKMAGMEKGIIFLSFSFPKNSWVLGRLKIKTSKLMPSWGRSW